MSLFSPCVATAFTSAWSHVNHIALLDAVGSFKQNLKVPIYAQCQISSTGENPSANLLLIVPPGCVCSASWNSQPYRSL